MLYACTCHVMQVFLTHQLPLSTCLFPVQFGLEGTMVGQSLQGFVDGRYPLHATVLRHSMHSATSSFFHVELWS